MGKTPRRVPTARVLQSLYQAALRCLGDPQHSCATAVTEKLEQRQMLSASPAAVRKSLAKLDSNLASAYEEYQQYTTAQTAAKKAHLPASTTPFTPTGSILETVGSDVLIEAYANAGYSNALALALKRLKGQNVTITGREIDALFPISALGRLASLGGLRFAEPTAYEVNTGAVTSQGDTAVLGPSARSLYNVSGAGVTVGILSDSFNSDTALSDHYSNDVASGDLPANVEVLNDATSGTGTDEGRAMAQVIYDSAPGASLAFATGGASYAIAAKNVQALATAGAKVIVDDLTYENEPFFEDGSLAQAVETVISNGVDYISAAGNYGENSYANTWTSGANYSAYSISNAPGATPFYGGTSYSFTGVNGGTDKNSFQLTNGSSIKMSFQWDQPYFSASGGTGCRNQVDAYVLNSAGVIVGGSSNVTIGADPIQLFQFTNTTGSTGTYRLMLVSESGTAVPGQIKYIDFAGQATNWAYTTNSGTVFGHANAAGVESVGATSYSTTPAYNGSNSVPILESTSSEGGTPILFNISGGRLTTAVTRQAPSIVGPDNVFTTFFGTVQGNNAYPTFSGTSASAAAVAGVTALIEQKNPSLTPAAINLILADTALQMQTPVPNNFTGYGLIQAIPALTQTVGNVTGTVFSDNNANGLQDSGETGIGGVTVYLDTNNNGTLDYGETYATTNSAGVFTLYNQPSGTVVVRTVAPAGFIAVTTSRTIVIAGANTSSGVNFGLFPDAYTASANGSNFTLQVDATKTANLDVLLNNTLTYTAPLTLVPGLSFSFKGNNSSLTVNYSNGNPIPAGGISEDAPLNTSTYTNNDVLTINGAGSTPDTANVNFQSTTFDGSLIVLNNVVAETINAGNGGDVFSVTAGQPAYQSLTFNGGAGSNTLTINGALPSNGSNTVFNAGTNSAYQNTLNVNAGYYTFPANPTAQAANLSINLGNTTGTAFDANGNNYTLTVFGGILFTAGVLNSGINQRSLTSLSAAFGNTVILPAPPSHADREVLIVGTLNLNTSSGLNYSGGTVAGAVLDLNANDMIITNASLGAITPLLASGYASGNWNGSGIQSSAAAANTTQLTALGVLQNSSASSPFTTFDGVGNIASAVLIKYTYYGDANLDGKVDGSDYSRIDNGALQSLTGWSNGDFNYDTQIDGSDYTLLDNAYNTQGPSLG